MNEAHRIMSDLPQPRPKARYCFGTGMLSEWEMEVSVKKRMSQQGFTLTEVLIVVAILTIVSAIGLYSFRDTRLRATLREGARTLSGDLIAARNAARTRGEAITVSLAFNDRSYLVYADGNGDGAYTTTAAPPDTLIIRGLLSNEVTIFTAISDSVIYSSFNYTSLGMLGLAKPIEITLMSTGAAIPDRYRITIGVKGLVHVDKTDNGLSWSKAW